MSSQEFMDKSEQFSVSTRSSDEYYKSLRIQGSARVCADCKHMHSEPTGPMCYRDAYPTRDLVSGEEKEEGMVACFLQRATELTSFKKYCGIEGRFFEPKQS